MVQPEERTEYDLIVVGAGTAGLPCAIEAAQRGARVLVVERSDRVGGTLHVSGGHLSAAGARRQRERGIEDTPERHLEDVMRISRGTARAAIVRRAVELAPATVDWLEDLGFDFAPECPRLVFGHEPYSVARTYYGTDEARSILAVLEPLFASLCERGAIDLRLAARARDLIVEEERVVGTVFETGGGRGGERVEARGRAVVLTSGGFAASPELFARLHRRPLVSAARETSTGDAIGLVEPLGVELPGRDDYLPTFGGLPSPDDPARAQWHDRPLLVAAERDPWEIYVGRDGRRFVAEDETSVHEKEEALAALADLTFFTIFDDRAVDESADIVVGWSPEEVRSAANSRPGVFVAQTLTELAGAAGIDGAALEESVARYNRAAEAGVDPDYGRRVFPAPIERAPYYAMQNHGITLITFAGVDVDDELRVRGPGGPIAGLYAAGEAIGASATCGRSFCGGMLLTPALSFGRWLGRRLAQSGAPEGRS